MEVKFQPVGVVSAQVVIAHFPGLEEPEADVEAEGGLIDALGFEYDLVDFPIDPLHKLIEQFDAHLMSAILLEDDQHCDVGLPGVGGVDGADDAGDGGGAEVGHDREVGPGLDEVVVGEDGVGLGELGPQDLRDPLQLGLFGEGLQGDLVGEIGLHLWDIKQGLLIGESCLLLLDNTTQPQRIPDGHNSIMKIQNLQQVRQELFGEQVKLTPKQKIKKQHFLLRIPLFDLIYQKKGDQNFQMILGNIRLVKVDFGEIIFQNEDQRSFNYIVKGAVLLFTRTKNEERREQAKFYKRLEAGQHFGEKMQYGKQELESARSATSGYLLQLPMNLFYNTFSGHFKYEQLRDRINFLKSIWVFGQVKRTLLEKILLSSESRKYTRNTVLTQVDTIPEEIMVIMDGELTLNINKEGKSKAFCVLGKGEVCGIEEIIEDKAYEYTASVTSDYAEILKVNREVMVDIVDRDIKPELINKRRQLVIDLKEKNLDTKKLMMYSQKQLDAGVKEVKQARFLSHRKRYKSQGGQESSNPINRMKVLNQLFNREVQLKQSQLRRYRLQQIEQSQKHIYNSNRISTYTNHSCTYDKQIIVKYLGRKERKYQDILRREREFIERRMLVIPELRVERSSAVKNQKRKLKHSRKQLYSTLQIYD